MITNRIKNILIALICLLPGVVLAQHGFVIHGKVESLNSSEKVYLKYMYRHQLLIDSAILINGKFSFTGNVNGFEVASINLQHNPSLDRPSDQKNVDKIDFYLDPDAKLEIFTVKDSIKYATVKGSKTNLENEKYKLLIKDVSEKKAAIKAEWDSKTQTEHKDKTLLENIKKQYAENYKELNAINKSFIEANRNSFISLVLFKSSFNKIDLTNADAIDEEFKKFPEELQKTILGTFIARGIAAIKQPQKEEMAPDFTLNDSNGRPVKLSDFRGKYVLVDFWASWCQPCRRENPNVVAVYKKFKDKNFTVLGVSSDGPSGKTAWLKAIQKDGLTWTQLLEDQDNSAVKLYDIKGIPSNFLIDTNGKIIAKNVFGEELQNKLSEVLNAAPSTALNPVMHDVPVFNTDKPAPLKTPTLITKPVELTLLVKKTNNVSSRLILPISQVGSKAIDLRLVFDTGSQGLILDAKKILPAEIIGPDGIMMNGQSSITVNGITITNIKQQAAYGNGNSNSEHSRVFYGQIAYASIVIGDENNQLISRKMPFLLIYKGVNKKTQLPVPVDPFCDGICGVNSSYTSDSDNAFSRNQIKSPFDYMNYVNNVNPGIELQPLDSYPIGNGMHPAPIVKVGVTREMERNYNCFSQVKGKISDYYSPNVPSAVKFNGKKINVNILFDTGTSGLHPSSFLSKDFVDQEDIPAETAIEINASGFNYNYITNISNRAFTGPGSYSIVNLTFFNDHHYLLDYKKHYIGFY